MEPISSSAAGIFRSTPGASNSEGAGLLRDGKVVQAEVLSQRADGTLVLAIGRHTVPAESELRLDVGARFAAQVEAQGDEVVLRYLVQPEGGQDLLGALRAVVGDGRALGELLFDAAAALRAEGESQALPPPLARLLSGLQEHVADPARGGAGLRTLLLASGLAHEATLAAFRAGQVGRPELERARADLKALLLAGLEELAGDEATPLRETVQRALDGLEAEQLVNLARERSGEPAVFSFPIQDGERWATGHLALPRRRERERDTGDDDPVRLSLGVELEALGPLRADLTLGPGSLLVRLTCVRPELLAWFEAAAPRLTQELGGGARSVQLSLRLGTRAEAERGLRPLDASYLQDHHVMSVDG